MMLTFDKFQMVILNHQPTSSFLNQNMAVPNHVSRYLNDRAGITKRDNLVAWTAELI